MPSQLSSTDFIKQAIGTANHFGFTPLDTIKKRSECKTCRDKVLHTSSAVERRNDNLHGMLTGGMCHYFDNKINGIEGPALFYTLEQVPRSGEAAIALHVFNVQKSIAEVLLMETVRSMLTSIGYNNYCIRVNSLGDKESVARYSRELTNYLRKRIDDMPAPARELMKEHVFVSLMHLIEREHELAERSPSPLEYLSDGSRKHFREIVEYLDISNAPYEIDPKLIGHHQCYSDALFAFDIQDGEHNTVDQSPLYIRGGRYDTFVTGSAKVETPAAGAVIVLRDKKALSRVPRPRRRKKPSVYVVQLGFGPKIKSLVLLSELRAAKIPVLQNIVSDSLSDQLRRAEREKVRYAAILGQKEYLEGNVILRDLVARSQEVIPLSRLTAHLKKVAR